MKKIRLAAIATVLCLAALILPGTAIARTITVGSELTAPLTQDISVAGTSATFANANLVGPVNPAAAPVDGRIVRWRLAPQPGSNTYRLTVLHPTVLGTYMATATSDPEVASSISTSVYTTALPIEAGDLIGLGVSSTGPETKISVALNPSVDQFYWMPALAIGNSVGPTTLTGYESEFNADLAPAPLVTRVVPASGPVGGGTAVTILGRDFTQVSGVAFGGVPASFRTLSESEISAVAPPGARAASVDVTVTNAIGTSPAVAADTFSYEAPAAANPPPPSPPASTPTPARGCKVPRLTGKHLPASRRILRRSGCRLGAVRGHRRNGDKVIRQSPRPGVSRPAGWVVNVTID